MDYGKITVRDIVNFVMGDTKTFPKGIDTPVMTGDLECNYTHGRHEIQFMKKDGVLTENAVCLGYEMHENIYD